MQMSHVDSGVENSIFTWFLFLTSFALCTDGNKVDAHISGPNRQSWEKKRLKSKMQKEWKYDVILPLVGLGKRLKLWTEYSKKQPVHDSEY